MNLKEYFNGDELASSVWLGKYALKNNASEIIEKTPHDMHIRMAKEFVRALKQYKNIETTVEDIFNYLAYFKYIVPQGSIMSALGNNYKIQSLSNCFVVPAPLDSYAGIFKTDQEIAQLEKRRGGVGTNLNSLRPDNTPVLNAAGTSTGAHSFMDRFSNTTREVAQNGRRGALMLLMSCKHPDVFQFVNKKKDRTKVTGANVSVQLTSEFMNAVKAEEDFLCTFPINLDAKLETYKNIPLNKLHPIGDNCYVMRINAKDLFLQIVENAWDNAEPGIAFMDLVVDYSPEGVYDQFKPIASNPCGEQFMQAYDACRLLALNLFSIVKNPFTPQAEIDYELLYKIAYKQQELADAIVDLEIEYVDTIISKIKSDPEPTDVKATELQLWENIRATAGDSRRTGCGITALGDMLAAMNLKYDSPEALTITEKVMKTKMLGELDCTIELAKKYGTFNGWDSSLEFDSEGNGKNSFFKMIQREFPDRVMDLIKYGRRNVSWSTVAPTGSVSILTQTTSGLEPLFSAYYMRRKKVNPSDKGVRVDFVDQSGDNWQEYPVVHNRFEQWIKTNYPEKEIVSLTKQELGELFSKSPWFNACANDIDWKKRIEIQSIIQKFTTNAISSTMNLPNDVSKETVAGIYFSAWQHGLKGVTIYRDGCRTGVLVTDESSKKKSSFDYVDAAKRPKDIPADLHLVTANGKKYGVVVGIIEGKPYEIFAFDAASVPQVKDPGHGKLSKAKRGHYQFKSDKVLIENIQDAAVHGEQQVLTRLVSGMLRHGAKPQFIMEQIDKCDMEIVSFGKAISRTLKKYVSDVDMVKRSTCKDCGSTNVRMQEGCLTCMDCGSSKCG